MATNAVNVNGSFVYNVNATATQVLAAKQVKENIFAKMLYRTGKGITRHEETNASSIRIFKVKAAGDKARSIGGANNGGFFNGQSAQVSQIVEYDLNLLYCMDRVHDLPETQQDMVSVNIFDETTKNIGGETATEINASILAHQIKAVSDGAYAATGTGAAAWNGLAVVLDSTPDYLDAFVSASAMLDEGDTDNGIQSFPFDERQALITSAMRRGLMKKGQILIGGSDYAQSMLAKGGLDPDAQKDFGEFYLGEIDNIPVYFLPNAIVAEAGVWGGSAAVFSNVVGVICAASATDVGISGQDYIKVIDSPDGAGKRLQPKTRWGVNVCYAKGVVPILKNGTTKPAAVVTISAPGNVSV